MIKCLCSVSSHTISNIFEGKKSIQIDENQFNEIFEKISSKSKFFMVKEIELNAEDEINLEKYISSDFTTYALYNEKIKNLLEPVKSIKKKKTYLTTNLTPNILNYLKNYQIDAIKEICKNIENSFDYGLFWGMSCGKTVASILACLILINQGFKVFIVLPKSLIKEWINQLEFYITKWDLKRVNYRILKNNIHDDLFVDMLNSSELNLFFLNYEVLKRKSGFNVENLKKKIFVFDEIHKYLSENFFNIIKNLTPKVLLTGTPFFNLDKIFVLLNIQFSQSLFNQKIYNYKKEDLKENISKISQIIKFSKKVSVEKFQTDRKLNL